MPHHLIIFIALSLFTAAAAFVDHRTGQIPNRLTLLGFLAGAALLLVGYARQAHLMGSPVSAALATGGIEIALGTVVCALVPLILFRAGAMGGGDVKLLAAIGAAVGPMLGLEIELTAFVLAALFAGARVAYQGGLLRLLGNSLALAANPLRAPAKRRAVPPELLTSLRFAPAVFASTLLTVVASWSIP